MGRDVTGIRTNTKPNPDSGVSEETAHVSPKILGLSVEKKDHEPNPKVNATAVEKNQDKQVLGTEKTDSKADSPRVEKPDSPVKGNGKADKAVVQPQANNETVASTKTPRAGGESADSTEKNSKTIKSIDMPTNGKELQSNSPKATRKLQQSDSKKKFDEEDNFSTVAASAKTSKFKTTVPVAPVFTCVARLEKRQQFYSKLKEKQAEMEAERLQNEARIKEKEQASLRQLRKNMVFKANPMPSFYREGPPSKPQLKKIPVTRAKSPKLSQRKSCGDVMSNSYSDEKGKENQHNVCSHINRRQTSFFPLNDKVQINGKNGEAIALKSMDSSKTVLEDTNNPTP